MQAAGWAGIISSTHSHLFEYTEAKREHWLKFLSTHPTGNAEAFLLAKGLLPRVAAGAVVDSEDDKYVRFRHAPCPKFRIVVPLLRSWRASDYPTQEQANATWVECINALAAALKLQHDQACSDTSRLFFLPRRPRNGPPPETCVIDGAPVDIFALPRSSGDGAANPTPPNPTTHIYIDSDGKAHDLIKWAQEYGPRS